MKKIGNKKRKQLRPFRHYALCSVLSVLYDYQREMIYKSAKVFNTPILTFLIS